MGTDQVESSRSGKEIGLVNSYSFNCSLKGATAAEFTIGELRVDDLLMCYFSVSRLPL